MRGCGVEGGNGRSEILPGTSRPLPPCQPAPSSTRTAWGEEARCRGCPGWMCWMAIPRLEAHFISFSLMYSGPLSTRMVQGLPRHSMFEEDQETVRGTVYPTNGSRLRVTRWAGREKSTSIPSPSRLKSSSTFSSRNVRPSPRADFLQSDSD